ncbi:unnamed protein product [Brassicogethes aeneus]|uniref:Uncharacterized protein n=1 Tax=Brassicogethes aeneus TaxID=1431903 RepID=A0A9P0BA33_BRAAE|nr:unnamed protein product [Brassicogethes aeneus]
MRAPVYLVCAATLMTALSGRAEPRPEAPDAGAEGAGRMLEPLNMAADPETLEYLLPRLTAKYRPNSDWTGITDPRFYLLTEMESNDLENQVPLVRKTRQYDSGLSINAPISTLYSALRQAKQRSKSQRNRNFLNNLPDIQKKNYY